MGVSKMAPMGRAKKASHLKPGEFAAIREKIGRGQKDIAVWLDFSVNAVSMMEKGTIPVPKPVAILMRMAKAGQVVVPEAK